MASSTLVQSTPTSGSRQFDGPLFHGAFLITAFWFLAGTFLDAWAHNNLSELETFWTPWHAVLYSGVGLLTILLCSTLVLNRLSGRLWHEALPTGYWVSLGGALGMVLTGGLDALWHTLFGIERSTEAVISPPHLLGMLCSTMLLLGPYLALAQRCRQATTWRDRVWLLLASLLVLALLLNQSQALSHFITLWPTVPVHDSMLLLALSTMLIQTLITVGFLLYTLRRWSLWFGYTTLLFGIVAIPMSLMKGHHEVILMGALSGVMLDGCFALLRPAANRPWAFRIGAVLAGAVPILVYLVVLDLIHGVVWSAHVGPGVVVLTAMLGWALSYLVLPAFPHREMTESRGRTKH